MQASKTYSEIAAFQNFAQGFLAQGEDRKPLQPDSKFKYAVGKMSKVCKGLMDDCREALLDIDMQFCATDEKGVVLKDARGGFEFKQPQLIERTKAQRELKKKTVSFEPYLATEPPPTPLSDEELEVCYGFVLEEPV